MDRNDGFWVNTPDIGRLFYSPATDTVQRFIEPQFDHVHFWDEERGKMCFQWMGREALQFLVSAGLPEVPRQTITTQEEDGYYDWMSEGEADDIESELVTFTSQTEIIDSLVVAETANLDRELDRFFE